MTTLASQDLATSLSADSREIDTSGRCLLLFQIVSALLWLAVGGALMLVHTVQLHTPSFFAAYEWFTFGHVQAAAETALLYGWAANTGFAMALLVLGRLGGAKPRGLGLAAVGAVFWNVGVTVALGGIFNGDQSGFAYVQLPSYSFPLLLLSSAAVGTAGVLAWADRKREQTYASQWYAAAGLFCLPWLLSAATVMLGFSSAKGVIPTVVASWVGENILVLWLSPLSLSLAYYLIPKIGGKPVPLYGLALGGFWTLVIFGSWTGTRVLSGGPFPVWIPTVGIAASLVLVIHYAIVGANLRSAFADAASGAPMRFLLLSVIFYVLGGFVDVLVSLRSLAVWLQFTYFSEVRLSLLVFGVFSPAVFAAAYYFVPRLTGRRWTLPGLIDLHVWVAVLGVLFLVGGFAGAGLRQAQLLASPDFAFSGLGEELKPWLLFASGGIGLEFIGAVFLVVNLAYQLVPLPGRAELSSSESEVHAS